MRIRLSWLIVFALTSLLLFAGCGDDDNDFIFGGSNPILESLYIGSVPVTANSTVNVPLASTRSLRFELSKPVSRASLSTLFSFSIIILNVDTGASYAVTQENLADNGELIWLGDSNRTIEYRLSHAMDKLIVGGQSYVMGKPGDTFRVRVVFMIGQSQDGNQFAFTNDEFYVVWTASNQSL